MHDRSSRRLRCFRAVRSLLRRAAAFSGPAQVPLFKSHDFFHDLGFWCFEQGGPRLAQTNAAPSSKKKKRPTYSKRKNWPTNNSNCQRRRPVPVAPPRPAQSSVAMRPRALSPPKRGAAPPRPLRPSRPAARSWRCAGSPPPSRKRASRSFAVSTSPSARARFARLPLCTAHGRRI
jgi:hypothetical protein